MDQLRGSELCLFQTSAAFLAHLEGQAGPWDAPRATVTAQAQRASCKRRGQGTELTFGSNWSPSGLARRVGVLRLKNTGGAGCGAELLTETYFRAVSHTQAVSGSWEVIYRPVLRGQRSMGILRTAGAALEPRHSPPPHPPSAVAFPPLSSSPPTLTSCLKGSCHLPCCPLLLVAMTKATNGWESAVVAGVYLPHLAVELHSLSTPAAVPWAADTSSPGSWCPADPTRICLVIRITRDLLKNPFAWASLQTHGSLAQLRAIRRRLSEPGSVPFHCYQEGKYPSKIACQRQGHGGETGSSV